MAFYFSQKNVDTANRTVDRLVEKLTPEQRLAPTPEAIYMIPRSKMSTFDVEKGKNYEEIMLVRDNVDKFSILSRMDEVCGNRLPILGCNNRILLIIHKSMVDRFLVKNRQMFSIDFPVGIPYTMTAQ